MFALTDVMCIKVLCCIKYNGLEMKYYRQVGRWSYQTQRFNYDASMK